MKTARIVVVALLAGAAAPAARADHPAQVYSVEVVVGDQGASTSQTVDCSSPEAHATCDAVDSAVTDQQSVYLSAEDEQGNQQDVVRVEVTESRWDDEEQGR